MKLCDLFEAISSTVGSIPVIKTSKTPALKGNALGDGGVQSFAAKHERTGNAVKQTSLVSIKDPVVSFINICMFNSSNPWLPKYKNAKIYDNNGDYTLITTCEVLADSLSMRELDNKNRVDFLVSLKLSPTGQQEVEKYLTAGRVDQYGRDLIHAEWVVKQFTKSRGIDNIKMFKYLFDEPALDQVYDILSKFNASDLDLHSGNFMWRGEQLVILDPVFGRTEEKAVETKARDNKERNKPVEVQKNEKRIRNGYHERLNKMLNDMYEEMKDNYSREKLISSFESVLNAIEDRAFFDDRIKLFPNNENMHDIATNRVINLERKRVQWDQQESNQ